MTIISPIFEHDPDSVAVNVSGRELTYGRLTQDIDTLAGWLDEHGVRPGTKLAIWPRHDHSYWAWVAHLAAMRVGAGHATVGPVSGTLQSAMALGVDLCLTFNDALAKFAPGLRQLKIRPKGLAPLAEQLGREPAAWPEPETERSARRVAFTSGTTGSPRGLLWSYDRILHRVEQAARNGGISASTRLHVALGLLTTAGFRYPLATWRAGGCVLRPGDVDEVSERREMAVESNLMVVSPVNLRNHLNRIEGVWQGKDERSILVLGGRLPVDTRDEALERACTRIDVNYGSTETGGVASGDAAVVNRHVGAVGFPGEDVTVEIVDAKGGQVPAGQSGVLRIKTAGMCRRYEGGARAADPAFGFRGGWFYPGDLAIRFEDGLLAITGRTSEVINVAGIKLSTKDLEARIARNPAVHEVCILPVHLRQRDVVAIVAVLANDVDLASLRREIGRALPLNCPHYVVRTQSIPRNAMGKVHRRGLLERVTAVLQRKDGNGGVGEHRDGRDG